MGRQWQIGDPVDYTTDGWMDAQNWGHGSDDRNDGHDVIEVDSTALKVRNYSKKAWDYYMEFKEEEALHYINLALDLNDRHANNWNRKAIILEGMERYAESEECYNRSLELSPQNLVYDNKARMLLAWSHQLLEESKELPNGLSKLKEAEKKIVKAMNALSGDSDDDIN